MPSFRIVRYSDGDFSAEFIVDFIHESFKERLEQGIVFSSSNMTAQIFIDESRFKDFYLALEDQTGELAGIMSVFYKSSPKHGWRIASVGNLAIAPKFKRLGIATMLFAEIQKNCSDCGYIESDTAVPADSSVRWHLHNGFRIVGLRSFASTSYYSYYFRKQLVHPSKWDFALYCKLHYLCSSIKTRCLYAPDGHPRPLNLIFK